MPAACAFLCAIVLASACRTALAGEEPVREANARQAPDYVSMGENGEKTFLVEKGAALVFGFGKTLALWRNCFVSAAGSGVAVFGPLGQNRLLAPWECSAVAAQGDILWVLDSRAKILHCVIGADESLQSLVEDPGRRIALDLEWPRALAAGGDSLFVLDGKAGKIAVVEGGEVKGSLRAPTASVSDLAWTGTRLWALDSGRKQVFLLDDEGRVLVSEKAGEKPDGVEARGDVLWILDGGQGRISRLEVDKSRKYTLGKTRSAILTPRVTGTEVKHLALPWNMNRQEVIDRIAIEPPAVLAEDVWGQPVAKFPGEAPAASISFKATMREIRYHVFPEMVGSMSDIPAALLEKYTADGSMLKIGDERIRKAAGDVLAAAGRKPAGEKAYWIARLGYEYTIKHVPYARGIPWISAPEALDLGKATCSPISFVFVAICRACGLPARFAAGTKFRGAGNPFDREFHRWPEVYLPDYGWISADASLPSYMDPDPEPAKIAYSFGCIPDNTFVLMTGGGESDVFGWRYNGAGGDVFVEWSQVKPD